MIRFLFRGRISNHSSVRGKSSSGMPLGALLRLKIVILFVIVIEGSDIEVISRAVIFDNDHFTPFWNRFLFLARSANKPHGMAGFISNSNFAEFSVYLGRDHNARLTNEI